ncbi:MAG: ATP-binding protein [Bacteroides sp.]|nr:ATP-binding protein [Bacteroides sp.]
MAEEYRPRIIDRELARRLRSIGAIVIEGAKWCGKSTTAEHHSSSAIFMDDPRRKSQYLLFSEENPELILDGDTPRLIDEWQLAPSLWDAVRYTVDHRKGMGQFILTGSAKPADREKISHSGTGRFAWIRMRPMSLAESGDSSGAVSLAELFDNRDAKVACPADADLRRIAFLTCRGGWPIATELPEDAALDPAKDYYNAVVNVDIREVDGVDRSVEKARRLMRSYARFQGTQTPVSQIVEDMNGAADGGIDDKTARNYLDALRSMFVIEEMPAWNPNLKSKTAIRTADTRYFVDPSIATAALGIGPGDLMNDLKAFGLLFETLCIRDLRVYAQPLGGEVYHFRDKNGLECDAVVHLPNGKYGLIEVKLGGEKLIDEGAKNLYKLASKIDTDKMSAPAFMMILTATGSFAYRREDGILVVPVTALGA